MAKLHVSKRKADALSNGVFLIGIGILFYTNTWWPGMLLVLWATLALRQYLTDRNFDLIVTSIILIGLFLITWLRLDWSIILPVLFVVGGIYIIFREYFFAAEAVAEDKSQEIKDDTDN